MSSQLHEKYNPRIIVNQHYLIHSHWKNDRCVSRSNTCYQNSLTHVKRNFRTQHGVEYLLVLDLDKSITVNHSDKSALTKKAKTVGSGRPVHGVQFNRSLVKTQPEP